MFWPPELLHLHQGQHLLSQQALNTLAKLVTGNMREYKRPGFKRSLDLSTVFNLYTELSEQIHPSLQHIHSLSILSVMFVKALINPHIDLSLITLHTHIRHANRLTD